MEESNNETLDLSRRGLKKIEKAPIEDGKTIINLILDQNELQRLDNLDTYNRVENLSICNNFLLRMHSVSRLTNIRILALNNNGILQIEGLKDLIYLKVLKLAGNNIKSIEHLNHNMHLEHLDLSNNQISFIADISYLKSLKHLALERNRIIDLRQCDRYLPPSLEHLGLAHNNIQDLNEVSHLVHLSKLDSFTVQGNPCVAMAGKDKLGFDYRPFVLNWILNVKSIDGFVVSAIESLKAEWLYSQGKGRHYHSGQHQELCEYLASTCPLTADALDTEDQRKLRLILSKAQHHQQQLKDQNHSPIKPKLQSPRMQSRMTPRHMGRSPDRLTSSYHSALTKTSLPHSMSTSYTEIPAAMSQSFDSPGLYEKTKEDKEKELPTKPVNQSLEAASKMVPVPESLMSPDYQDPIYDIQRSIPKPNLPSNTSTPSSNNSATTNNSVHEDKPHRPNTSTTSSNNSVHEDRPHRQITQPKVINNSLKSSPKLPKSATSSPKMKAKMEQRKGSLKLENKEEVNGVAKDEIDQDKMEIIKLASNQRRQKKMSAESMAAVTIQKMWRGYRSRNLNKDTLRILHAIQAARARQHIQRLTCDMEATKAALDSERKIQQLQMQAINALWKKVSTLQNTECSKPDNTECSKPDVLRQLSETCCSLQQQVVELQGCMQQVLRCVLPPAAAPAATQTDIVAVHSPQEERCTWLKRPQSLSLAAASAPASALAPAETEQQTSKVKPQNVEHTDTLTQEPEQTDKHETREKELIVD
ncbi:LOW QUALITY PROTEIN: centrosomal protein of 97 kDa [Leguminivora glycinivorella]|uniref:LOW QUALITY PROTEIN: centrosomal protein of 97 kDa n=1 Tax=Leguminivora glycinivorella TaxID=1035111 RepID=UPI00201061C5|nr:LOW QUALITY PROTEIN: centrosomal protein of 97 kDa [Leguminivora glycinivorella]